MFAVADGGDQRMKEQLKAAVLQALPKLNEMLLEERGQGTGPLGDDPQEQWDLFRALVNTRPAESASEEFLALQDEMLQALLAYRGVTDVRDIEPATGSDMRLWRGDITTLAADAVVNAANSQMLGCFVPGHHCIDNAIHTFAGVQLRLECARLMAEQGYPEPTGMAKATDAFNLPARHVIHTVGPIAEGIVTQADRALLANCYTSCLDAAADLGCESVAFCCISTGVFGFPQREAAEIAVATVRDWLTRNGRDITVVFDVFGDADEALYRRLLAA